MHTYIPYCEILCHGQLTAVNRPQHSRLVSESVSHRLDTLRNSKPPEVQPPENSGTSRPSEAPSSSLAQLRALEDEVFGLKREKARLESELQRTKEQKRDKSDGGESATTAAAQAAATAAKSSSAAVAAADVVHMRDLEDQVLQLKRELSRESSKLESERREKRELEERLRDASATGGGSTAKEAHEMTLADMEKGRCPGKCVEQIEQLQTNLSISQKELEECKKELAAQERFRRASPDVEAAKEIQQLQDVIRQAERDAETAQAKAAEELAAVRVASARELSKARVEGANRVKVDVEALNGKLREKENELEAAKSELQSARLVLADMQIKSQELEEEVATLRKAHRPCALLIEELRKKITNLQVTSFFGQEKRILRTPNMNPTVLDMYTHTGGFEESQRGEHNTKHATRVPSAEQRIHHSDGKLRFSRVQTQIAKWERSKVSGRYTAAQFDKVCSNDSELQISEGPSVRGCLTPPARIFAHTGTGANSAKSPSSLSPIARASTTPPAQGVKSTTPRTMFSPQPAKEEVSVCVCCWFMLAPNAAGVRILAYLRFPACLRSRKRSTKLDLPPVQ